LLPSQLPKPDAHARPQRDPAHTGVPLAAGGHAAPHEPQLLALDVVSMHTPPHRIVGAMHVSEHTPIEQLWPAGHALLHAPQCALLVCVF
jgi:hypothetical protein